MSIEILKSINRGIFYGFKTIRERKKNTPTHTPTIFPPPKLSYATMKKHVINRLNKGEYDKLRNDMRNFKLTSKELYAFFSKMGSQFLNSALIRMGDGRLKFWIEEIPAKQVLEILSQDDFWLFRSFLSVQVDLEKSGLDNEESDEDQINKFKVLLHLDAPTFKNFMQKNADDESIISEQITTNFEEALEQFNVQNCISQP